MGMRRLGSRSDSLPKLLRINRLHAPSHTFLPQAKLREQIFATNIELSAPCCDNVVRNREQPSGKPQHVVP